MTHEEWLATEYCDDITIRRVIVTVCEIVTAIEMVVRVNPFVDQLTVDPLTVPEDESERDQDLVTLLGNDRR
jgi:hypothetical protein